MVNVKTENQPSSNGHFVSAKILYEDINNHDQIVNRKIIKGVMDSPVKRQNYRNRIPYGYQFSGYGNFHSKLNDGDINVIYVKRIPTQKKGLVKVDYVDNRNQLIAHRSFTGQLGSIFHLHTQARNVPDGYRFQCVLVGGNVTTFNRRVQIVIVALDRCKTNSQVFIEYLCNGHKIGRAVAQGRIGSRFSVTKYRRHLPDHTHFVKFLDSVPSIFGKHDITIRIQVAKRSLKKTAGHSHLQDPSTLTTLVKNTRSLGSILSKIGTSLNSLGKLIQAQSKVHQTKPRK